MTHPAPILPPHWDPIAAADRVMAGLINVCGPEVKGAHDADLHLRGGRAYVIYEANDVQPGEAANWPFIYDCMSVVDLAAGRVLSRTIYAGSEMAVANRTLPAGCAFVSRGVWKDDHTLRIVFSSEAPGQRQSLTFYRDYDAAAERFADTVHPLRLETATDGVGEMTPARQHADAAARGYSRPATDFGLYLIDGIKAVDGRHYAVLNNFPGALISFGVFNRELDCIRILGHAFEPQEHRYSEAAFQPDRDGGWRLMARVSGSDSNHRFSRSADGVSWEPFTTWPQVTGGESSRGSFECFGGLFYLGWQQKNPDCAAFRSTYNLDVSRDGVHWERKYRFVSEKSFQYPVFREHAGAIYLAVTQGDRSPSRKERILFGKLEDLPGGAPT